ncbi:MAG: endolytic transglycosylase MltG [Candidatus Portnoybacteria bacterium]|nr:endolytic transglycosylase MltG [Candidatus Portnoybacteria bacterium]MDD4983040.1 endolytic transglycosylase MltG [Candidatus Portnoybacteria bacterium]
MENQTIKIPVTQAAEPQKKSRAVLFYGLAALAVLAAGFLAYAYYEIYVPVDKNSVETVEFTVTKGLGVKEISWQLEDAKLIRSAWWFETYIWYKKQSGDLQAGKYALGKSFSVPEIVGTITGGKVVLNEVKITFPEGFTYKQVKARLAEQGITGFDDMGGETVGDFQVQYKFLSDAPANAGLEGFLFPDTYIFERDVKAAGIIKKFLDNFDKKLTPDLREQISRQGKNIYNVVILASIVQQEAIDENDMPLVAGVFANRLQKGIALESDASVNYATGKKLRQTTYEDLKIKSPYNTYMYRGLPPGPIANPGIEAIRAAINPPKTDYLFFLHPLDGPTVFSKTLDEHNRNRAKYLK